MLQTIGISQARNDFFNIANQVQKTGQPITVIKNNIPTIVISPYEAPTNSENLKKVIESLPLPILTKSDIKNYKKIRTDWRKRAKSYDY